MFDVNALMNACLRNGILFGIGISVAAIVVFWRTLTSFVTTPTVIGFQPFFTRFLVGIGIGIGIVVLAILGIRYALLQRVQSQVHRMQQ
jgi:hypothetical protein